MDYSLGLGASLALSLEQIGDGVAEVLNALAFLGPEEITKELLKALARSVSRDTAVVEREGAGTDSVAFPFTGSANLAVAAAAKPGNADLQASPAECRIFHVMSVFQGFYRDAQIIRPVT